MHIVAQEVDGVPQAHNPVGQGERQGYSVQESGTVKHKVVMSRSYSALLVVIGLSVLFAVVVANLSDAVWTVIDTHGPVHGISGLRHVLHGGFALPSVNPVNTIQNVAAFFGRVRDNFTFSGFLLMLFEVVTDIPVQDIVSLGGEEESMVIVDVGAMMPDVGVDTDYEQPANIYTYDEAHTNPIVRLDDVVNMDDDEIMYVSSFERHVMVYISRVQG